MSRFKGHKNGFNKTGSNDCLPNPDGPPTTKFKGRSALPSGPLKHYPGAVADISGGNRRLAKSKHGDGGGSSTSFNSRTAFGRGKK